MITINYKQLINIFSKYNFCLNSLAQEIFIDIVKMCKKNDKNFNVKKFINDSGYPYNINI